MFLDIEVQKMKKAVESLMAANEEKVAKSFFSSVIIHQSELNLLGKSAYMLQFNTKSNL